MGRERDEMHREEVEQRRRELESQGYNFNEAKRLAKEQIVHDHDPRDD
jgi:hypothetical protein